MKNIKERFMEVDLALFRGEYVFKNIRLERTNDEEAVDFLEIEHLRLTVGGGALKINIKVDFL